MVRLGLEADLAQLMQMCTIISQPPSPQRLANLGKVLIAATRPTLLLVPLILEDMQFARHSQSVQNVRGPLLYTLLLLSDW